MNRIVRLIILFSMGLFGRTAFSWFAGSPSTAQEGAPDAMPRHSPIAPLIEAIFGQQITPAEASALIGLTGACALGLGFLARFVLGDVVFGGRLNAAIALAGAWGVLALIAACGVQASPDQLAVLGGVCLLGGVLALAAAAVLKVFIAGEFDAFMTGGQTRTGAALRNVKASTSAANFNRRGVAGSGPSAERLAGAVNRAARNG